MKSTQPPPSAAALHAHYYLSLDQAIQDRLNASTVLWQYFEEPWPGFENPTFLQNNKVIATSN